MADLTRNGVAGLELTREEVIDLKYKAKALVTKAQCREVHGDIVHEIEGVVISLFNVEQLITELLEGNNDD